MAAAITAELIGLFPLHGSEKVLCVLIAVLRLNDIAIQSRCPCKSEITLVLPFGVGENMGTALSVVWRPCRQRSNTSIGASLSGVVGESLRHVDPELRPRLIARLVERMPWGMRPHVCQRYGQRRRAPEVALRRNLWPATAGAAKILLFACEPRFGESGQLLISVGDLRQGFL
jgi:hypothetical protein